VRQAPPDHRGKAAVRPPRGAAGPPAGDKSAAASGTAVCDTVTRGDACVGLKDSVAYPKEDWSVGQRLFNIYDGPAYQDANAYLDIPTSQCDETKPCMYAGVTNAAKVPGVRRTTTTGKGGFLPNAAIGWKQPNGFYYPPAFNSQMQMMGTALEKIAYRKIIAANAAIVMMISTGCVRPPPDTRIRSGDPLLYARGTPARRMSKGKTQRDALLHLRAIYTDRSIYALIVNQWATSIVVKPCTG